MIPEVNKLDAYTTDTGEREIKKTLGKEDFLRLLVTQMQFQDPLKPMEHTEFTAQLAQFSSLDQLFTIGDGLESLSEAQGGINRMQSVNFIGKEVKASGNKVYVGVEGHSSTIGYSVNKEVSEITVNIFDRNGIGIRTVKVGPQNAGSHSVEWDGRDDVGGTVPPGEYRFFVTAKDSDGKGFDALTNVTGIVTGVTFEGGVPYLIVNGIRVPVAHITEVKEVSKSGSG